MPYARAYFPDPPLTIAEYKTPTNRPFFLLLSLPSTLAPHLRSIFVCFISLCYSIRIPLVYSSPPVPNVMSENQALLSKIGQLAGSHPLSTFDGSFALRGYRELTRSKQKKFVGQINRHKNQREQIPPLPSTSYQGQHPYHSPNYRMTL